MKIIESSSYKKAQLSNHPSRNVFPSDRDEAYFLGEDDPDDIEQEKLERQRRDYKGVGDSMKRTERWSKVYPHMDKIKKLKEQLNNPNIGDIERKEIRDQIGYSTSAISNILNTVGKLTEVPF